MLGTKLVRSSPLSSQAASLRRHFCPLGRLTTSKEAWRPLKWLDWQALRRRRDGTCNRPQNTFSLYRSVLSPVRLDTQRGLSVSRLRMKIDVWLGCSGRKDGSFRWCKPHSATTPAGSNQDREIAPTMGRPCTFDTEKRRWTSTQLAEAMGPNPPSLDAAFGSKARLFRAALDRYTIRRGAHSINC